MEALSWDMKSFHRLNFVGDDILHCLKEENLIGSGGSGKVYKGELGEGEVIAVKQLWTNNNATELNHSKEALRYREFKMEVETLGSIRHKNMVKFYFSISSTNSKLFVYEYMKNGSLWDRLHQTMGPTLDWQIRYKIALGIAHGLAYLHNDCVPAIVHRDVKSINILLDEDCEPRLADFSVAKILQSCGKGDSTDIIVGTHGYIAQEKQEELMMGEAHPGIANFYNQCLVSGSEEQRYPPDLDPGEDIQLRDTFLGKLNSNNDEVAVVNVESFGALGDGITDDTQAFINAWQTACSMPNSVFLVPEGYRYLVQHILFKGPCNPSGGLIVQIEGTVVAPDDPTTWDPQNPRTWLVFSTLNGLTIQGGGVVDGSGQKWWAQSCKINKSNPCRSAPTVLTIESSWNVIIRGLSFQNSQQMHIVISQSFGIQVRDLLVVAPGDSPNTDGIHITHSQDVVIHGCKIATGDDCISIVAGSANVKVEDVVCGPGHGISVGSLGKDNSEAYVAAIVVDGATLTGTTNGLRIKTWQGGSGFAQGIRFQNILMNNVSNPIIIDQFYCDAKACKNQTSAVRVSEVVFRNVKGTSQTRQAIKLACSDSVPCNNIILDNVDLENIQTGNPADSFCSSAAGFRVGSVNPDAECLQILDDKAAYGPYCLPAT